MAKATYNNKKAVFAQALKGAVDQYFTENGIKKTGNWRLYTKTLVLIPVAIAMYILLLTVTLPAAWGIATCAVFGFLLAGIGFNVMHDACHGSYSSKKWVNELLSLSLNALGGNSFIWKQKHNVIHHTYTNIDGIDDDIAKSPIMRQCHTQPWKPFHRIQHLYVPLVYAISSFVWVFIFDILKYFSKQINHTKISDMNTKEHVIFWASKVFYLAFYIVIPILCVGVKPWAIGFLAMHMAMGFTLAIVFQLAHVVEETEFEVITGTDTKVIENEWAIHQVKTTANFAPDNKVVSWFVGGLNYQIEHHLFARISHVHYPAISKIVKQKCEEFNIQYTSLPSMNAAIVSHFRFMRTLGRKPAMA